MANWSADDLWDWWPSSLDRALLSTRVMKGDQWSLHTHGHTKVSADLFYTHNIKTCCDMVRPVWTWENVQNKCELGLSCWRKTGRHWSRSSDGKSHVHISNKTWYTHFPISVPYKMYLSGGAGLVCIFAFLSTDTLKTDPLFICQVLHLA